jgi:uncharacterized membrane protein (UPF0127 family)
VVVTNPARGATLGTHVHHARNVFERGVGLLFRRELPAGGGLLIEPCNSIHSFFMRFRFDAAFLDRDRRVVHAIHAMAPWRVSRIAFRAKSVLELPAGALRSTGTEVGDRLEVRP